MNFFLVGDVHAVKVELDDCRRLIDLVAESVRPDDNLVFLGDLYDNHGVIDLAVQKFWTESLARLDPLVKHTYILAGNHDMYKSSKVKGSAVSLHVGPGRTVIDGWRQAAEEVVEGSGSPVRLIPFCHAQKDFDCLSFTDGKGQLFFAHNSFTGAQFENGFFDPSGFDVGFLGLSSVISGHIHREQTLSGGQGQGVWYPGAPRWFTKSDANAKKAIYRISYNPVSVSYKILDTIPTDTHCSPIYHFEDRESQPLSIQPLKHARYFVDLYGSDAWIKARREIYSGWARVSVYPTRVKQIKVKESDGIQKAFSAWSDQFLKANFPAGLPLDLSKRFSALSAKLP